MTVQEILPATKDAAKWLIIQPVSPPKSGMEIDIWIHPESATQWFGPAGSLLPHQGVKNKVLVSSKLQQLLIEDAHFGTVLTFQR